MLLQVVDRCLIDETLSVDWPELEDPEELEPDAAELVPLLLPGEEADADSTLPLTCIWWPTWSLNCAVSPVS